MSQKTMKIFDTDGVPRDIKIDSQGRLVVASVASDNNGNAAEVRLNPEQNEYELAVNQRGHVCAENSTTDVLDVDEVFTGDWQDTLDYGTVTVGIIADQNSATDGLVIQWSADATNVAQDDVFTITANAGKVFTFGPANRYVRVKYTNGGSAQTSFNLQTIMRRVFIKPSSHRINDSIVAEDDAQLMKSVLTGENPSGTFVNFKATTAGNFKTSLEEFENTVSDDSNSALKTSNYIVDEFGNISRFLGDNIYRGCLLTMPVEHHEIHCGDSYECSYITDLSNGGVLDVLIIVPNEGLSETHPGDSQETKQYHFKGTIATEAEATIEFFEGVTVSANGTALDVYCRNRNFSAGDEIDMYHTPTVTGTGTRLVVAKSGSGRTVGGTVSRSDEFILKDNTMYLLRITNDVTTNEWVSVELNYYVHPGV